MHTLGLGDVIQWCVSCSREAATNQRTRYKRMSGNVGDNWDLNSSNGGNHVGVDWGCEGAESIVGRG